jgi:hypothetical protein
MITSDKWGGGVQEAFRREGLHLQHAELTTSDLLLEITSPLNSNMIELLDQPRLLHQLGNLQPSVRGGGRDRVEHRSGQHDDVAAAAAGACVMAAAGVRRGGLRPSVGVSSLHPTMELAFPGERSAPPSAHVPTRAF